MRNSRHVGARNRSTMASMARKSGQTPPNPGQAYSHCITPEPTAGPSSYICRWCIHKKSREKMHSGSRAAVRKSLGRVRLIYPLGTPGTTMFIFPTFRVKRGRPVARGLGTAQRQHHVAQRRARALALSLFSACVWAIVR